MHHLDLESIPLLVAGPMSLVQYDFVALVGRMAERMVEHDLACRPYLQEEDHKSTFLVGNMSLTGYEAVEEHFVLAGDTWLDSSGQKCPSVVVEYIANNKTPHIRATTVPEP
jgi:hypothetical protein